MSREDFRVVIADVPDKEEPVAEVHYKNEFWVDISYEDHEDFVVQFYNKNDGDYWEFPYEEAMSVLQEAKDRLARMQRTPEQQAEYDAWIKGWEDDYNQKLGVMSKEERREIYPPFLVEEIEEIQNNPELKKEECTKITHHLQLIKVIWSFSNKNYQEKFWVRGEPPMGDDTFEKSMSNFLSSAKDALQAHEYKHIQMTPIQHQTLKTFDQMVHDFMQGEAEGKTNAEIIAHPDWDKIRRYAKLVYKELSGDDLDAWESQKNKETP